MTSDIKPLQILDLIGTTIAITAITGLLYLSGYHMAYSKFRALGLPTSMIQEELYQMLLSGRGPVLVFFILLVFILLINRKLKKLRNRLTESHHFTSRLIPVFERPNDLIGFLGRTISLIVIYYIALYLCMNYQADYVQSRIETRDFARLEFSKSLDFVEESELYLLSSSDGEVLFLAFTDREDMTPTAYIARRKDLGNLRVSTDYEKLNDISSAQ